MKNTLFLLSALLITHAAFAESGATPDEVAPNQAPKVADANAEGAAPGEAVLGRPAGMEPDDIEPLKSPGFMFSSGASYRQLNEDSFLDIDLMLDIDAGMMGVGLWIPAHFMLKDNFPAEKGDGYWGGILREEEWDETSEKVRFIRYLRFGKPGSAYYLRVGDLQDVSIGHGTIMGEYRNNINPDHWFIGGDAEVNTVYGGVKIMTGNFFDPYLFGGRIYIRPFSFIDKDSYWNNLAIGLTAMGDIKAPFDLKTSYDEGPIEEGLGADDTQTAADAALEEIDAFREDAAEKIIIDENAYPVIDENKGLAVIGGDVEFRVLNTDIIELTPYADLNKITAGGLGFHNGILTNFAFSEMVRLNTRLEWRAFQSDYIPKYFDSAYEIYRFVYPVPTKYQGGRTVISKREYLDLLEGGNSKLGWLGEGIFTVINWISLGVGYEDYQGEDNSNIKFMLDIPGALIFDIYARYYKFNFEKGSEIFEFDDRSLFVGMLKANVFGGFFLAGKYWRTWQFDTEVGKYEPTDNWSVGGGWSISF